jgi:hypothetical protein
MNTSAPVRSGPSLAALEALDARFLDWTRAWRAEEVQFPALIDAVTLAQAGYPAAFPHLLLSACRCADPAQPLSRLLDAENLAPSSWLLSPAVCYHAYAWWAGQTLRAPRMLTARGRCFRHETGFVAGRRQIEFEMREIILCGPADWIEPRLVEARARVEEIAAAVGLAGEWEAAEDPFFLPTAKGQALLQRLQETKKEFVIRDPAPLALASVNRHGTFFGERFSLRLPDGQPAHTACIAFGLDRWAGAIRPS